MIKMVAIDLDGTMYNSKKEITQEVKDSIQRITDSGVKTAIITGRGMVGSELALKQLNMDMPYICSAGALIRSGHNGKTLQSWSFHSPDETAKVIWFALANNIALLGETLNGTMIWYGATQFFHEIDEKTQKEIEIGRISDEPLIDFNVPLLKLTLSADTDVLRSAQSYIEKECPSLHPVISGAHYIDITAQGINKGTGIKAFTEFLGFQPDEVAAIGDQEIDIYMLSYVGLPIAMENGVQKVKEAARWIAPSNDQNGVAWALDEIIKLNRKSYVN